MSKYTEETLDKLLKKGIISIVLSQQTEMDAANSEIIMRLLFPSIISGNELLTRNK